MKVAELQRIRAEKIDRMQALHDGANHTTGLMTDEQETEWVALEAEVDQLKQSIKRGERMEKLGGELENLVPANDLPTPANRDEQSGFANFGELANVARFRPHDERLQNLASQQELKAGTSRPRAEQSMSTGSDMGFLVPGRMSQDIMQVEPQDAVFTNERVMYIPAGDQPDSKMGFPVLDQTASKNMYGGVEVTWVEEGEELEETSTKIREATLEPKECGAYIVVTDKLLRNVRAADAFLRRQLSYALAANRDTKALQGSGKGTLLGLLNSPAAVAHNRATGGTVKYTDLAKMKKQRLHQGREYIWIVSDDVEDQIDEMEDSNGSLILRNDARDPTTQRMLGYPIVWNERSPSLGSKGDVILADLSYYLFLQGAGPFIGASEHVFYRRNKTVIRIIYSADGRPWLSEPVKNEGGRTKSPFVLLDAPSS